MPNWQIRQWSNTWDMFSASHRVRVKHMGKECGSNPVPHCPQPAVPSASVLGSKVLHTPTNGREQPCHHHATNTKPVPVITTRAWNGCSTFANKSTSVFLKAIDCSHSLKYFSLNRPRIITVAFPTDLIVSLVSNQILKSLDLSTVRNAPLGIQLVCVLLKMAISQ